MKQHKSKGSNMNDVDSQIIEIYRGYIERMRSKQFVDPKTPKQAEVNRLFDEEIAAHEAHIRRLETNHADCVKPCCPSCKLGGLKKKSPAKS